MALEVKAPLRGPIETLIFDYDGTLHDSVHLYYPAFLKAFRHLVASVPEMVVANGYSLDKRWTVDEVSQWLGYTKEAMWASFMPKLPEALRNQAGSMIGQEMNSLLSTGHAMLYEGALETLATLKGKGYRLIFLSNCSEAYMTYHTSKFRLDEYFDLFACAGQYPGLTKAEILKGLIDKGQVLAAHAVMIGDRTQDMEAGQVNNLQTVGCRYGFGQEAELAEATVTIDTVAELVDLF